MGKPAAVRRAAAEADALIAALNAPPGQQPTGEPGTPPAPPAPPGEEPPQADPNPQNLQLQPGEPPQPPAPPAAEPPAPPTPPREDWKHKYLTLQGKYDMEMARKDAQIQVLNERLVALEQLISRMQAPPQAPATPTAPAAPTAQLITPEDREEYGQSMIDMVTRAARQAVEPELQQLRVENSNLKRQLGQTSATVAEDAQSRMHAQLDQAVPDWREINSSPTFVAWLREIDVFSGRQRHELLLEAYGKNDAARVQRFFQTFKQEDSAIDPTAPAPAPPRVPAVDPATLVAPGAPRGGGGPGVDAPGGKRVWTQQEIAVFYDKKRRGRIPPDEAARIEREIIEASSHGRVR